MPNSLYIIGLTDIGRNRKRNEDSVSLAPALGVAVVADGMGGHPGGDVASRLAAEAVAHGLESALDLARKADTQATPKRLRGWMLQSIMGAHELIRSRIADEPELNGMGTTITAMVVDPETDSYVIGNAGDSRAYLFRQGKLTQLTRDDTWVQERVEKGDISPEAVRTHPFGHLLTQCLGLEEPPKPQILAGRVEPGDRYLLCSDGLVGMLKDEEIEAILSGHAAAATASSASDGDETRSLQALVDAANAAGGHDNITTALVRIDQDG